MSPRAAVPFALTCVLLGGCLPSVQPKDGSAPTPDDTGGAPTGQRAALTTTAQDYTTGSFATVGVDDWSVDDAIFVTSGDPVVKMSAGVLYQINRYGYDNVRAYVPGDWQRPRWEVSTGDYSNPVDVERCGEALWVALYEASALRLLDPETGLSRGSLDLSAYGDGDGVGPEAAQLFAEDDVLYVVLNRLDRVDGWARRPGQVVRVDCAAEAVTGAWWVGGNPRVTRAESPGQFWVASEASTPGSGEPPALPAGLYRLDTTIEADSGAEPLRLILASPEGEPSVGPLAAAGGVAIFTRYTESYESVVDCVGLDGGPPQRLLNSAGFINAAAANAAGEVWLTSHWGWTDPDNDQPGVHVVDPAACALRNAGAPIATRLAPTSLAFY